MYTILWGADGRLRSRVAGRCKLRGTQADTNGPARRDGNAKMACLQGTALESRRLCGSCCSRAVEAGEKQTQPSTKEEVDASGLSCARLGRAQPAAPVAAPGLSACRREAENRHACACCRPDPRPDLRRIPRRRLSESAITASPPIQKSVLSIAVACLAAVCALNSGWHMATRRRAISRSARVWGGGPASAAAL
ncbi:hypothetical protein SVAN01_01293 [Stagonosporopsis vannaccii]|nr:hypothetical protein SVAN01_01293 [Stagonosporopsis vannaccii]